MASFLASFIALSIGGMITSGYLVWKHYQKQKAPLVCPLNHDCSKVTESKWSSVLYIRNEVLGLLFYGAMLLASILLVIAPTLLPSLPFLLIAATAGAMLFSLFLIGIQIFKIKDYCFYCLISALISILLFVNSFFI